MKELPVELWCTIFNDHISSIKQLGECRLVCRAWDYIAESAMFRRKFAITASNATQFYYHLSHKSAKGKLIKHLQFDDDDSRITYQRAGIAQLGFTPTIQSLAGYLEDSNYVQQLIDIVKASPVRFNNMKSIITLLSQAGNFSELASLFKDTLQELSLEIGFYPGSTLDPTKALSFLDEFRQLQYLQLVVWGEPTPRDWEIILQKCSHLTSLYIEYDIDGMGEYDMAQRRRLERDNARADAWAFHDAQKFTNIQRLELHGNVQHSHYFLHKFPNLHDIRFIIGFIPFAAYEDFSSVLKALKCKESYHIEYACSYGQEGLYFTPMFELAKRGDKSLTVKYKSNYSFDRAVLTSVDSHEANTTYKLKLIDQGLLSKTMMFTKAMSNFNQLKRMELFIDRIKEQDINANKLPHHKKLATLIITGAKIDANVISTFDACFPALKSLKLDQCQITATEEGFNEVYPVALPQKWLRKIAIVGLPASKRPTLLHLELLSKDSDLYFLLLPYRPVPLQLTEKQFRDHSKELSFIFSVACQYVNTLEIKQGDVSLSLDVDKYST
ncbi:hypothetical protein MBANPS3_001075 [Mucor bainieri]